MSAFGKPLWVTEVACMEFTPQGRTMCTEAEALAFMDHVVKEAANPAYKVERYAWFGALVDANKA